MTILDLDKAALMVVFEALQAHKVTVFHNRPVDTWQPRCPCRSTDIDPVQSTLDVAWRVANLHVAAQVLHELANAGFTATAARWETREEWASHGGLLQWGGDEASARHELAVGKGPLVRRTVHIGPWSEVTS
jgi:hypothetical protein